MYAILLPVPFEVIIEEERVVKRQVSPLHTHTHNEGSILEDTRKETCYISPSSSSSLQRGLCSYQDRFQQHTRESCIASSVSQRLDCTNKN